MKPLRNGISQGSANTLFFRVRKQIKTPSRNRPLSPESIYPHARLKMASAATGRGWRARTPCGMASDRGSRQVHETDCACRAGTIAASAHHPHSDFIVSFHFRNISDKSSAHHSALDCVGSAASVPVGAAGEPGGGCHGADQRSNNGMAARQSLLQSLSQSPSD
jgi:hypothetical protein